MIDEIPGATVGVILNNPLTAGVEYWGSDGRGGEPPLPLRYGGPFVSRDFIDYSQEAPQGGVLIVSIKTMMVLPTWVNI